MILYKYQIVVIGTSAGGFKALHKLLPLFGKKFHLPIVIVQHRKPVNDPYLAESWGKVSKLSVREASEGVVPAKGKIYIAPPDRHLVFDSDRSIKLISTPAVNYSRPSIDVTMISAAEVYGGSTIGIILTGASKDGAEGMLKIKQAGGMTISQNPTEAEVDTMPRAAIGLKAVDFILSIDKIPDFLANIMMESRINSSYDYDSE